MATTRYILHKGTETIETLFETVRDSYIALGWDWMNDPKRAVASSVKPEPEKQTPSPAPKSKE